MSRVNTYLLVIILILAAGLRFYQLTTLPISLFGDEIDVGYQAWSLSTTGRDYMGHWLPFYIQSLNEWRAPLLMYVVAPVTLILGPTTMAVRLPIALMGILNIFLLYLFINSIFNNKKLAILGAFLLTITPWHIHYSRAAFEVTLLLNLILGGSILFIRKKYFWSLILFVLTFYTYSTAMIFTPLLVLILLIVYRPIETIKKEWYKLIPGILLVLPIAYFVISGPAAGRFGGISIFSDQKGIDSVIISRTESWVKSAKIEQFFHNKPILYVNSFVGNYLSSFSPSFLFLNGDPNFRQSTSGGGELPLFLAPFLLLGVYYLFENREKKSSKLVLSWLLISPVASSLTIDGGNHATRLFVMLPPLIICSSLGLVFVATRLQGKVNLISVKIFFVLFSLLFVAGYWHGYSAHYRYQSFRIWQDGYEKAFSFIPADYVGKRTIYINNTYEPSLLKFLFYKKYPPSLFQKQFTGDKTVTSLVDGFDGFRLNEKIYFGAIKKGVSLESFLESGDIYLASQKEEIPGDQDWSKDTPVGLRVMGVAYDVFNKPLFTVVEKK